MKRNEPWDFAWDFGTLLFVILAVGGLALTLGCEEGQQMSPCGDRLEDSSEWPAELLPCKPEANPYRNDPPVDIPRKWRISNYKGGSCNHAAFAQVLIWQQQPELAKWWKSTYSGGEDAKGLGAKADKKGLKFAATYKGDEKFLEWCSDTRRGAAIHYYSDHAITFCGFTANGYAVVLDNNNVSKFTRIKKATFIARWKGYGGKAITVVYDPPPPKPWVPSLVKSTSTVVVGWRGGRVVIRYPRPLLRPRYPYPYRPRPRPRPIRPFWR